MKTILIYPTMGTVSGSSISCWYHCHSCVLLSLEHVLDVRVRCLSVGKLANGLRGGLTVVARGCGLTVVTRGCGLTLSVVDITWLTKVIMKYSRTIGLRMKFTTMNTKFSIVPKIHSHVLYWMKSNRVIYAMVIKSYNYESKIYV